MMAYRLDGDNVRFGLNKDLAFSEKDRKENIRRFFPPLSPPFFPLFAYSAKATLFEAHYVVFLGTVRHTLQLPNSCTFVFFFSAPLSGLKRLASGSQ
jgi:hypothetical protein